MRDRRQKDWFWVDNALVDRKDLNLYEKMLYRSIYHGTEPFTV